MLSWRPTSTQLTLGDAETEAAKSSPSHTRKVQLWSFLDALSCLQRKMLGAWLCQKPLVLPAGSQLAEPRSQTCRSHIISQRSSLCPPAGPSGQALQRAHKDGSGSKEQRLGSKTGKPQTALLSCSTTKPATI